jgi:hypothetical protein
VQTVAWPGARTARFAAEEVMIEALIGGVAIAAALLILMVLKLSAGRGREAHWTNRESVQSILAVGLVSLMALGGATIISTVGSGWPAPSLGFAVAVGGGAGVVIYAGRLGRRR